MSRLDPEVVARIKAINDANEALWKSQTIIVDEDWSIQRFDAKNWHIQYRDSREDNFYGTLLAALKALPAKMLSEEAKGSLQGLLALNRGIVDRIDEALDKLPNTLTDHIK